MKRAFLIFALCALLNATALGQDSGCPVKITDVRSIAGKVSVLFRNTSQNEIAAYDFIVWFVDSEEQTHFLPPPDPPDRGIKAGRGAVTVFSAPETLEFTFSVANAYLLHVTFADGAVWNDDGSHACSMASLQE